MPATAAASTPVGQGWCSYSKDHSVILHEVLFHEVYTEVQMQEQTNHTYKNDIYAQNTNFVNILKLRTH